MPNITAKKNSMKRTLFISVLKCGFRLVLIVLVLGIFYVAWKNKKLNEKYINTELNISQKQLITEWGIPDEEFDLDLSYDKRHIIKYSSLITGQSYIFAIKYGEKNITEKYIDD